MGTLSTTGYVVAVAGILLLGVLVYVLFWRRFPKKEQPADPARLNEHRMRRTIRILRILTIGVGGMALLLTAHLVVVDKEAVLFLLLHEIGFALIVSLVVWAMFEAQLSHEAEATWDRRIERVTKNVFQAVLRKDLPKELLDEANNLVLNSRLTRNAFTVTYTLADAQFEIGPGKNRDCVVVDALMEFTMHNVSTEEVDWPVNLLLPNPVHAGMKQLVAVRDMTVTKGGEAVILDLEGARRGFLEQMEDNSKTRVPFSAGKVLLRPGEACEFSASYVMAKEAEDTELLSTLYPADGLRITIFDTAGDRNRITFARSVHRQPVEIVSRGDNAAGNAAKIFRVPGYLLPHQGVLIWWKRRPDRVAAEGV